MPAFILPATWHGGSRTRRKVRTRHDRDPSNCDSSYLLFRFANMDFIVWSVIQEVAPTCTTFYFTYDIACIWSKNFFKRLKKHPEFRQLDDDDIWIRFVVPKFHLLAHGKDCQRMYSLNNTLGAGRSASVFRMKYSPAYSQMTLEYQARELRRAGRISTAAR